MTAARRRLALLSPLGGCLRFMQPPNLGLPPLWCSGATRHCLLPLSPPCFSAPSVCCHCAPWLGPPPTAAMLFYHRSQIAFGFCSCRTFAYGRYNVRLRCAIACRRYPTLPLFLCAQFPSLLRAVTMTAARRRYGLLPPLAGCLRFPQPPHPRSSQLRYSVMMYHW